MRETAAARAVAKALATRAACMVAVEKGLARVVAALTESLGV